MFPQQLTSVFVCSRGWAYGDSGHAQIRQFSGSSISTIQNETLTLAGSKGRDVVASEDTTHLLF